MPNIIKSSDPGSHDDNQIISGQPSEAHGNEVMVPSQHIKAEPHMGVINYHVKTAPMQHLRQHHHHHQHHYWKHLPHPHHPPVHQLAPHPPPLHLASEQYFSPPIIVDSVAGPSSSVSAPYRSLNVVSTVQTPGSLCDDYPLPLLKPKLEPPTSPDATTAAVMMRPSVVSPYRSVVSPSKNSTAQSSAESSQSAAVLAGPLKPSIGVPMATQTEVQPDTEEEEDANFDEDTLEESSAGSSSLHQPIEMPSGIDRSLMPENVREHFDKITAQNAKLHSEVVKQKQLIRKLRVENASKCKEIDQIKDLNIILQLELEKYKSSDLFNTADRETKVSFPDGITLTAYNLKDLECCEIGEKGDSAFILKMLLALYTREELRMKSITGKPSRNKKYVQDTAEKFSPKKLQFIKDKFRERVSRENTMPTEREKRCRDERVHKIINTKIQNLKRKKATF